MKKTLSKFLYSLSILWGVITLCFILFYVFPDADDLLVGQRTDSQTKDAIRKELGLDQSATTRYFNYLKQLSPVAIYSADKLPENGANIKIGSSKTLTFKKPDLGYSYINRKSVSGILGDALVGTFVLAGIAMAFAFFIGVILGVISALNYNKPIDSGILTFSTLFISIPSFFASILIAWLFGFILHKYTGLNMTGSLFALDMETGKYSISYANIILPATALAVRPVAIITQLMRSSLLSVLQSDYIRTAKAKGLTPYNIIVKHALKNALNPVITASSGWFASMLAGAFFVEYIFNWKGIGKVLIESVQQSDLPLVSGGLIYIAIIFILVNIIVDYTYKFLDPKLK